ncbi:MAG: flagellar hook-length control protein FliK [Rhodocyclaceae bacterium]|nr:flagellar hook-length control protein FliK [Rhodocyclaceae bacterium]
MPEMPMNAVLPTIRPEAPKSAAASAPAAPSNAEGTQGAGEGAAAKNETPFAAVLKKQMAADKDSVSSAAAAVAAATAAAATPEPAAQFPELPAADTLTALIPLLAAQQNTAPVAENTAEPEAEVVDQTSAADAALATLLPTTTNVAAPNTDNTQKALAEKPADPRDRGQPLPVADGKAANTATAAANLAATESAAVTEKVKGSGEAATPGVDFTAALHAARQANEQMARTSGPSAPSALPQGRVETPMGAAGWANEVGDKMTWMAGSQLSKAELVLTPPNLGRIEISLSIKGDQATAQFVSANPEVRETLEASMPRLREVLADAGVNLGQTHVGAEAQQQWSAQGDSRDNRNANDAGEFAAHLPDDMRVVRADPNVWVRRGSGMLDVFA